ncbi:flagellar hook-associated protein 1 FlgK [Rhodovulum iodosum]|uniref:Flagellar hook-associated protein 1 n=1 Tax=Rhodovulum iodosum TaxID=68291 RepID=A0ABV3XT33_9RHOB|nr:flagellar hook-associated protein FlgK [Rhodovulum robiginosum]RSK30283.1 flagellar hook-associated protein FlgK [Rhodovulum robiginosum]
MSISGTMANALSGLHAAARGAELVSANIANASTEGYGRRSLELSAALVGGRGAGVQIDGVARAHDAALTGARRQADAAAGAADARAAFYAGLSDAIGLPETGGSLSGRIAGFEAALASATAQPESEAALAAVRDAAAVLAGKFNGLDDAIQGARMAAEAEIAAGVGQLNDALARVEALNTDIVRTAASGHDTAALQDRRQALIDGISGLVALRQVARENGAVALYTETGTSLLDGRAAVFSFAEAGVITADMRVEDGRLSDLYVGGRAIDFSDAAGPMAGGRLAALFEQRDALAPAAQQSLDALARDLIERFQNAGLDPTQPPGAAGLFTDSGAALDPADESGLAGRISVNPAVDPAAGGALWRLRDGLGAVAPGTGYDTVLLNGCADAMQAARTPASGPFSARPGSAADLAARFLSSVAAAGETAAAEQSYTATRRTALQMAELAGGVDTDTELQDLLRLEEAYAANAKVLQTASALIDLLMEI